MFSGDAVQNIRDRAPTRLVDPRKRIPGKRYCESCRSLKPTNARPHVKGWVCDDCEGTETGGRSL